MHLDLDHIIVQNEKNCKDDFCYSLFSPCLQALVAVRKINFDNGQKCKQNIYSICHELTVEIVSSQPSAS